jgi:hypothetical protein
MTLVNPEERPNASMAVKEFERLLLSFDPSGLKRRVWRRNVPLWDRFRIQYFRAVSRFPLLVE